MKSEKKWIVKAQENGSIKNIDSTNKVIEVLLKNRNLKTKKERDEFFYSSHPDKLTLKELGLKVSELSKIANRLKSAIDKKEEIVVYGDYDADGVTATAILWESLYSLTKKVTPYLPDRFSEGYGLNSKSINALKEKNPKLKIIITVDNGIVANDAVDSANKLGIDVIVTDHHQKGLKLPNAFSIFHTDKISGSGVAWILAREIEKKLNSHNSKTPTNNSLELAAIGTVADQLPLIGPNRSIVKHGLEKLAKTKRPGLLALYEEAAIKKDINSDSTAQFNIGTYEINYLIAPRINAMGRMEHSIDSLRLLCTTSKTRATELAANLGRINKERQKVVSEVTLHAENIALTKKLSGAIILAHESYHEGVIGLAAGKLTEKYYRPAIVLAKGAEISKASARSISGFNIIEALRKVEDMLEGVGGHPMAAGFSIKTERLEIFEEKFQEISLPLLSDEVLQRVQKVDLNLDFDLITKDLVKELERFEPFGIGNPKPVFMTESVEIISSRLVGAEGKHLKLTCKKGKNIFDAIGFGLGEKIKESIIGKKVSVVYNVEENVWNGNTNLQLNIKDTRLIKSK